MFSIDEVLDSLARVYVSILTVIIWLLRCSPVKQTLLTTFYHTTMLIILTDLNWGDYLPSSIRTITL